MVQAAVLTDFTTHMGGIVISSPNIFVTINALPVATVGSKSSPHINAEIHMDYRQDLFAIPYQSYIKINGLPVLTMGSIGVKWGSVIIPNPTNGRARQNFIWIN